MQVVLIAEMLLLVAVDDKGHVPVGSGTFVKVGLTGALLAELAMNGQLTIGDVLERVAPDRSMRGEAKKQIARATAETPFAPGVAKIIDDLIAAMAVTAVTTATA